LDLEENIRKERKQVKAGRRERRSRKPKRKGPFKTNQGQLVYR